MRRGRTSGGLPCRPFSSLELPFYSSVCLSRAMYILVVNSICAPFKSDVVVDVYSVCVKDGQARSDCTRAALDRVLSIFAVRRLIILRLGYRRAGELFVCVSRASFVWKEMARV